jgi:chromosome transmission fidelity protein 18
VGEVKGVKRGIEQVEGEKKVVVERVKKDFFGRVVAVEEGEGKRRKTDSSNMKIQPNVWVRFHEGYSNAVRKPVIFAELLGRI